jgi:4-hydroxybenzoate polyprenyltransferase
MLHRPLALLRITRPVKSTLISLGVSLPIALTSSDWGGAFVYGAPTLLISMSAYTLNDLHDVERDLENHPERPLPQQDLSLRSAVILFFVLLTTTLVLIEAFLPTAAKFLFAVAIIASMAYSYIISHFPMLKNAYVALISILPLLAIRQALGELAPSIEFGLPLFLFIAGVEMLSDIKDRAGDGPTLANRLGPVTTGILGFGLKLIAAALFFVLAVNRLHFLGALLNLAFEVLLIGLWVAGVRQALIIKLMAIQLVIAASLRLYPS